MKKKTILIACASILLLAGGIFASHQQLFAKDHGHGNVDRDMHHALLMQLFMAAHENPGMSAELMDYCGKNVFPVVKAERAKLEELLTEDEKKTITEIRAALKTKQPQIVGMMQAMHNKLKNEDNAGETGTANPDDLHRELMQTVAPMKSIAEKYQPEITAIADRLSANAGEWHKQLKNIGDHWKQDKAGQQEKGHAHSSLMQHFKAMHKNGHADDMHDFMAIHFLLLDPSATSMEDFFPVRLHDMKDGNADGQAVALSVYPNPAHNNSTIDYEVKSAGTVIIDIIDKEGKTMENLLNGYRQIGKYSLTVDLQKYHEGTYYVRYTDAQNTSSKILLKQ